VRQKRIYKTAEDVLEEAAGANGAAKPTSQPILDLRGPEARLVTDLEKLNATSGMCVPVPVAGVWECGRDGGCVCASKPLCSCVCVGGGGGFCRRSWICVGNKCSYLQTWSSGMPRQVCLWLYLGGGEGGGGGGQAL
jgi:hypothetical protein